MKIRQGFVSNSSSSSFLAYGSWVDKNDFLKFLNEESEADEDEIDDLGEVAEEMGLDSWYVEGDGWFVGRSLSEIGEDQTLRQFKKEIDDIFEKHLGEKLDCAVVSVEYPC